MSQHKPIRATLVLRNNRLVHEREKFGVAQRKMASYMQVPMNIYCSAEKLRPIPFNYMQKIADHWERPVDYFFPESVKFIKHDTITKEIEAEELKIQYEQRALIENKADEHERRNEIREEMQRALSTLSEREAKILGMRFGLQDGEIQSLELVAKFHGVTPERVRQIALKAIRKLRHPSRSRFLYASTLSGKDQEEYLRKYGYTTDPCKWCDKKRDNYKRLCPNCNTPVCYKHTYSIGAYWSESVCIDCKIKDEQKEKK